MSKEMLSILPIGYHYSNGRNEQMTILLYIDPGTGSMLFSLLIGLAATAVFGLRALLLKLKFGFGKKEKSDSSRIPYVIFSDHKRYWNVFKGICEEFDKRGVDVVYYTLSQDDPVFECGLEHIHPEYLGEGNKPYSRLNFLKADILISTTPGLDVYQWKRSRDTKCYIHIPHSVDDLTGYRMFGLDHYDVVLASGINQEEAIRKIESLRPGIKAKEIEVVGSTYMDDLRNELLSLPERTENETPVILVAPSWGPSAILSKYGDSLLSSLEKTGFHIIVRPHPQSFSSEKEMLSTLMEKHSSIEWNRDNNNFPVMERSDILITDFSGIIFDYALTFNRPIVYADTHFDTIVYDADWLDEEMWSLRVLPKLGIKLEEKDFKNIKQVLLNAMDSRDIAEEREEVKAVCLSHIGESRKTIVDYLVEKEKTLKQEE